MMRSSRYVGHLFAESQVAGIVTVLGTLAAWQLAARLVNADYLPTVPATFEALKFLAGDVATYAMVGVSLRTMFTGFFLALLVSVPLGLAMGRSRVVHELVNPLLTLGYPMPKAALMPIITLWFGLGVLSKVLVVFLGASLPLIYHSYVGATKLDEKLIWQARAFGMSSLRRLVFVVLPIALPDVFLGCRVGLAMALIVMVSSEMIVRQAGIGNVLFNALDLAQYETVYAVIVIIAGIGAILDLVLEVLRRRIAFWSSDLDLLRSP